LQLVRAVCGTDHRFAALHQSFRYQEMRILSAGSTARTVRDPTVWTGRALQAESAEWQ
jgi:hypothetical protein